MQWLYYDVSVWRRKCKYYITVYGHGGDLDHVTLLINYFVPTSQGKKVQVGNDQEKAQSERESLSKTEVGKTKLTTRHIYHENIS